MPEAPALPTDSTLDRLGRVLRLAGEGSLVIFAVGDHDGSLDQLRAALAKLGPFDERRLGQDDPLGPGRKRRLVFGADDLPPDAREHHLRLLNVRRDRIRVEGIQLILFLEGRLLRTAVEWIPDLRAWSSATVEIQPPARTDGGGALDYAIGDRAVSRSESVEAVSLGDVPSRTRFPSDFFVGRGAELRKLEELLSDPATRILSVVGQAGCGKSALVAELLGRRRETSFVWRFGENEMSGDEFLIEALRFFGEENPLRGSLIERGERLAGLVAKAGALIILDGVDAMIDPLAAPAFVVRDPAAGAFLDELAHSTTGAAIVTSRRPIGEPGRAGAIREVHLGALSDEDAAGLLKRMGVQGPESELWRAAHAVGGGALAVRLLGALLIETAGGAASAVGMLPPLSRSDWISGDEGVAQARRVLRVLIDHLARTEPAYVEILGILSLFDRPATRAEIDVVRWEPVLGGLTDRVATLDELEWDRRILQLQRLRMISPRDGALDAHAFVRELVSNRIRQESPEAFRAAHGRLYEHFRDTSKQHPETRKDLEPLYRAIVHGCKASRYEEAFREVYYQRIHREKGFGVMNLGAWSADLAAIRGFFAEMWTRPVDGLGDNLSSAVLNTAGLNLRAMGRIQDADAPLRAALQSRMRTASWANAAAVADNLSGLQLALGNLTQAVHDAEESVLFADRSGDAFRRADSRTTLAEAYNESGRREEATRLFIEAERIQAELQPKNHWLYSLRGYRYCDLLLDRGDTADVLQRAAHALGLARQNLGPLSIAVAHLTLGRAHLLRLRSLPISRTNQRKKTAASARFQLDKAFTVLREAGVLDFIPRGLLARAAFFREIGEYPLAHRDLDETLRITTRCGLRLFEADAHLERARLFLAEQKLDEARAELALGKKLVEETGYGRRTGEVAELTRATSAA